MTGARAPPEDLSSPDVSPNSLISCDVATHGVIVYIDGLRTRRPKCRMWVYRAGAVSAGSVPARPSST